MFAAAVFLVFPLCLVLAALTDFLEMKIPNRIPLVLAGAFLALLPFADLGQAGIGMHLAAGAIVFAACFGLFALNVMGGGDAKLLTAASLWFGLNPSLLAFLVYVSVFGGILTLLILMLRGSANMVIALGVPVPQAILSSKKVPYGIAIAIAGLVAFPQSPLFLAALAASH